MWLALAPRMKTEVWPPGPPVWTTFSPGMVESRSGAVRHWWASMSASVTRLRELPISVSGVGTRVAVITNGATGAGSG